MKSKAMRKLLASMLAMSMVAGVLAGCGSTDNQKSVEKEESSVVSSGKTPESAAEPETVEITYPMEGDHTLTMAITTKSTIASHYEKWTDTPFAQAWQEQTGVNLEVTEYADEQAMALMMASGELPDIIVYNFDRYSGGTAKAIEDQIIQPLNDYVDYIPDMMAALEMEADFIKDVTTGKGDIIGFPNIKGDVYLSVISGMVTRQDWLDKIGMEAPTNPDEFYQMLKAYKEKLNVEYPLSMALGNLRDVVVGCGYLTTPFDLPKGDWYVEDGKIYCGYAEVKYKDVLEYLHMLYEEGLIDPNFSTIDVTTQRSNFMNGLSGVVSDSAGSGVGGYVNNMPDAGIVGIPSLVSKEGDTPMSGHFEERITRTFAVITSQCEEKEVAAQFLNYLYSEEGHMLANFGIEGVSYEMVDGKAQYTDLIMNNPDGLDKQTAMSHYIWAWEQSPIIQDKGYGEQYFNLPEQIQAKTTWSQTDAQKYFVPYLQIAEADQAEYTKLFGDIDTYRKEMFIHYVDGTKDLADFETEYLGTLKEMGIDKVIEMRQVAYDQYNAR